MAHALGDDDAPSTPRAGSLVPSASTCSTPSTSAKSRVSGSGRGLNFARGLFALLPAPAKGRHRGLHGPRDPAPSLARLATTVELVEVHITRLPAETDPFGSGPGLAGANLLADPLALLLRHPREHREEEIPDR